jgi:hypothetical protein
MRKHLWLAGAGAVALYAGVTFAQYPIMNMVAERVIQKYQSSTCEQLWQTRGQHGPKEQEIIGMLRNDPQMRQAFINQVAGPVVNKMFECGMVP